MVLCIIRLHFVTSGKKWPSDIDVVPAGMHVELQESGWMTEKIMVKWLDSIIAPHTCHRPCLLVMDSFAGHTTQALRQKLEELNITPAVIPGGCTSKVNDSFIHRSSVECIYLFTVLLLNPILPLLNYIDLFNSCFLWMCPSTSCSEIV